MQRWNRDTAWLIEAMSLWELGRRDEAQAAYEKAMSGRETPVVLNDRGWDGQWPNRLVFELLSREARLREPGAG